MGGVAAAFNSFVFHLHAHFFLSFSHSFRISRFNVINILLDFFA